MLKVEYTTKFKRDLKLATKRRNHMASLQKIMKHIEHEEPLSSKLRDHPSSLNWKLEGSSRTTHRTRLVIDLQTDTRRKGGYLC